MRWLLLVAFLVILLLPFKTSAETITLCQKGTYTAWFNELAKEGHKPRLITDQPQLGQLTRVFNQYPPTTSWKPDTILIVEISGPRGILLFFKNTCAIAQGMIPYRDLAWALRTIGYEI